MLKIMMQFIINKRKNNNFNCNVYGCCKTKNNDADDLNNQQKE